MKMSREEFEQACHDVVKVIPPPAMATTFNGGLLPTRECVVSFEATLPTVIGDELRRTERKTSVRVYPASICRFPFRLTARRRSRFRAARINGT